MNQPIHNAYWLSRFDSLLDSALAQHRAVSLIRVDLRFPEWICPYISRHLLSLNPLLACCRRYSRGER